MRCERMYDLQNNRPHNQRPGILILPAIKYSSLEELIDCAVIAAGGDAHALRAIGDSLDNLSKMFLRYVNRRAREGQNLYFDVFIDKQKVKESSI